MQEADRVYRVTEKEEAERLKSLGKSYYKWPAEKSLYDNRP